MARPAALKRFPSLRTRPAEGLIVPPELRARCPALEEDFAVLDRELLPRFQELDRAALQAQNQFRLEQVLLILGGVLAVVLGALQGALRGAAWPGVAEALVGGLLAVVGVRTRELRAQRRYLTSRVKAERLRGEYFRYLGRVGEYAGADRAKRLAWQVASIYRAKGQP
jgi:Protein of unknown function (DUF4231)